MNYLLPDLRSSSFILSPQMLLALFPEKSQWDGRTFDSPWLLLGIVVAYLYFVFRGGPRMMANKPPYSLRGLVLGYNALIVLAFLWYFNKMNRLVYGQYFAISCRPESLNQEQYNEMTDIGYYFFLFKLVELLDTVFFILRKKFNQASLLHVYHHTNMLVLSWFFTRAVPAGQLLSIIHSNTFLHILIYSYYFLSALGPGMQKYLWWKKYLLKIELIQFFFATGFIGTVLLHPGCQISKEIMTASFFNGSSFIAIFLSYNAKFNSQKKSELE